MHYKYLDMATKRTVFDILLSWENATEIFLCDIWEYEQSRQEVHKHEVDLC